MVITLFNRYSNPETRAEEWRKTRLSGTRWNGKPAIHWESSKAANATAAGVASGASDAVFVAIWFTVDAEGKKYLPARQYAALPPNAVDGYWTLQEGQTHMVKADAPETDLKAVSARYDDCITVSKVDTVDYGSAIFHHWEVSGR